MPMIFACWFCVLQFFWIYLLVLTVYLVLRVFYIYDHGICKQRQFYIFLIWKLFIFFFFLSDCSKTSSTMLNKCGESGHPCLVSDLRGKAFNLPSLIIMLAKGFSYMAFVVLIWVPPIPILLNAFYHKWILNLVKCFSCIYWMIMWFCLSFC